MVPGASSVRDSVYEHRFMHVPELQRMGADIRQEGACAFIKGAQHLTGTSVMASDLRAFSLSGLSRFGCA
jgi:UDP-N-acetylglucosamine 1-carboxyvinyltransferase